ncbi:neuropeptide Y receptor type 2-like [Orbicella faveolata]|uniref:neuropeptide Y receptor type 2-like n=1 Tax=Orbicella faveolata TaxID=48498 RepID=UPI0009E4CBB5|nr:neuropeptide Y receptor type 2-like [Orbicella faveolata]
MENNTTAPPPPRQPPLPPELVSLVQTVDMTYLISGIYLSLIAIMTIFGNGLLLLAIITDPFKSFRTPTTLFVVGLAVADFLTGAVVDPLTAFLNIATYLQLHRDPGMTKVFDNCVKVNIYVSFITMNASFLMLLALTFCQYLAISFPHKHRAFVTRLSAMVTLVVVTIYSVLFSLLPEFRVPRRLKLEIDTHLNTNAVAIILILTYLLLYLAYRVHLKRVSGLDQNDAARNRRREQEREFTAVNLLLVTFFLIFTLPSMIFWNLRLYKFYDIQSLSYDQRLRLDLASTLIFDVLVMKFALDPCIYAWRLSKYRQAIKKILKCGRDPRVDVSNSTDASSRVISTYAEGGEGMGRGRARTSSTLVPLNSPQQQSSALEG